MKKYLWIFFILILVVGVGVFLFSNKKNEGSNYIAERTGTSNLNLNVGSLEFDNNNEHNKKEDVKMELAEFTTKLPKDTKERESNIKLACNTLNGTVVKKEETFSFWHSLGATTKEKGYEKAKTFTSEGETIQSYGGGVCQVSTTIYNAVLEVEGLEVIERHEHSKDVAYIKDGKDAAVSFESKDLKFKNTLDYDIKIEAKVDDRRVKIKLLRI